MEFDLGCRFAATSGRDRALSLVQGFAMQRDMQSLKKPLFKLRQAAFTCRASILGLLSQL